MGRGHLQPGPATGVCRERCPQDNVRICYPWRHSKAPVQGTAVSGVGSTWSRPTLRGSCSWEQMPLWGFRFSSGGPTPSPTLGRIPAAASQTQLPPSGRLTVPRCYARGCPAGALPKASPDSFVPSPVCVSLLPVPGFLGAGAPDPGRTSVSTCWHVRFRASSSSGKQEPFRTKREQKQPRVRIARPISTKSQKHRQAVATSAEECRTYSGVTNTILKVVFSQKSWDPCDIRVAKK